MFSNPPWRDVLPGQRIQPQPLIIPRKEPVPLGPVLGQVGQRRQLRGDGWVAASFLCIWISVFWGWASHNSHGKGRTPTILPKPGVVELLREFSCGFSHNLF